LGNRLGSLLPGAGSRRGQRILGEGKQGAKSRFGVIRQTQARHGVVLSPIRTGSLTGKQRAPAAHRTFGKVGSREGDSIEDIGLGDRADIAGQKHLHGQDTLPVGEGKADLRAIVVGVDVLGAARQMSVQEIEDFRQSGRL